MFSKGQSSSGLKWPHISRSVFLINIALTCTEKEALGGMVKEGKKTEEEDANDARGKDESKKGRRRQERKGKEGKKTRKTEGRSDGT
jgi:hypothetical protein